MPRSRSCAESCPPTPLTPSPFPAGEGDSRRRGGPTGLLDGVAGDPSGNRFPQALEQPFELSLAVLHRG